jgi:hypothetical protein
LKKFHKILPKHLCQQKSEGKLQFFHFWQMIIKVAGLFHFGKDFFTLSPDLNAASNSASFDFLTFTFYVLLAFFANFEAKCSLNSSENQNCLFLNVSKIQHSHPLLGSAFSIVSKKSKALKAL